MSALNTIRFRIRTGVTEYTKNTAPVMHGRLHSGAVALHLPETTGIDERVWWHAILAPLAGNPGSKGTEDSGYCHGLFP